MFRARYHAHIDVFRRAKIKLMAKKSIETGEDCDAIPESMRNYLALQAMESGKPLANGFLGRTCGPVAAYGSGGMLLGPESGGPSKVGMSFFLRTHQTSPR